MFLRKSIFGTASMLGLAGILAFSGCSSGTNSDLGNDKTGASRELGGLGLGLLLPDGSDVNDPTYTITRTGDPSFSMTGTLTISGNVASGTITGLPAGNDYHVALVATRSRDSGSVTPCTGSADFTVIANSTTDVTVVLQCDDTSPDTGNVTINGTFNICPKPGVTTVTPNTAVVGSSIALTAAATDKDSDPLTYAWSATDGTFSSTSAASTSYTCTSAGSKTISLTVTDGPTRGCTKSFQPINVTCTGATIDSGTPVVDSGTPVVDSGTPVVDAGPPARFGSASCDTCVTTECTFYQGFDAILPLCTDAACDAAFACFQRNHCSTNTADINQCYCGVGVDNATCLTAGFVANGPCATLANTTFGTTNAQTVVGLLYDESSQFGVGANLFNCASDLCNGQCVTGTYPAP